MNIPVAPEGMNYDARSLYYFEVYPDGTVNHISSDLNAIRRKDSDSLYGAYFRAVGNECTLYCATFRNEYKTTVFKIDDLGALADSVGIAQNSGHAHEVSISYNACDDGKDRYAAIDIIFHCGCSLCSTNKRSMAQYLNEQYGLRIVLNSIDSRPLSQRTIKVERNSIDWTRLPK